MRYLISVGRQAIISLKVYGFRTFLTILGIVVGVTTVVAVLSVGSGVQQLIVNQLESFGGKTIFVEVRAPIKNSTGLEIAQGVQVTTLKDSDRLRVNELPNVEATYGVVMGQEKVTVRNVSITTPIMGTTEQYVDIDDAKLVYGRFFTDRESTRLARVVVLGYEMAERLFTSPDQAIGQSVRIGDANYQVIGVMEERGTVLFQNMDKMIYMPLGTTQKLLLGIDYLLYFTVEVQDEMKLESTAEYIRQVLRRAHRIPPGNPDKDDFRVTSMEEAMSMLSVVTTGAEIVLILVACVSLLVGGVGIMNTMYVSVVERTKEIGVKRAIGGSRKTILLEFLMEAFAITAVGSFVGIVLGSGLAVIIATVAERFGFGWDSPISFFGIVLAFVVASAFGLVFGYYPAKKASELDPVEALRSDA